MEPIEEILNIIDQLPPLPQSIQKLKLLLKEPNVNYHQISEIINEDPGLTADILKIINSPFYGLSHKVESIEIAISMLGLKQLIDIVTVTFSQKIIKEKFTQIPELEEYFKHSQLIALAITLIAQKLNISKQDINFYKTVGILHDIGRLVIILFSVKNAVKELLGHWDNINEIEKLEQEILKIDHTKVGELIARKWQFSDRIANAILLHHTPFEVDPPNIDAAYILLAHFITMPEVDDDFLLTVFNEEYLNLLKISPNTLKEINKEFKELLI